jgi:dihydrodipicolinate synthase/N-acetylneuraminate lyase
MNSTLVPRRSFLAAAAAAPAALLPRSAEKSNALQVVRGPLLPVITHFNRDLSLDLAALRVNISYLVEHGIQTGNGALLVAGAGGDFPMLSIAERRAVLETAMQAARGKSPVIFGGQSNDLREVKELARIAEDLGAYALQISPPFYYTPSDDDVLRWFRSVNSALRHTGIMAYNTHWHGYHFQFPVLDQVMDLDRVVSLKWSTPNGAREYTEGVARYSRKVAVVDNALMWQSTFLLGGTGFVTHLSNVWPEFGVGVYQDLAKGRYREATEAIVAHKWPWSRFRSVMARQTGGEAPPVRAALEICGRPGGRSRPPCRDLNEAERAELRSVLRRIGVPGVAA